MVAVALVGGDGAGKSSIARQIVAGSGGRMRLLYMGMNPQSSNFSLPTTKLVFAFKKRKAGGATAGEVSLHSIEYRRNDRGRVWAALRLVNRIAEELWRQTVAWVYQARGKVVLFDRHFLFDFWPGDHLHGPRRLTDRAHLWFLRRLYPKPDLVLFLDAPSEVLVARKSEVPVSYLDRRREAFIAAGRHVRSFRVVDANRPLPQVLDDVRNSIDQFLGEEPQGTHFQLTGKRET